MEIKLKEKFNQNDTHIECNKLIVPKASKANRKVKTKTSSAYRAIKTYFDEDINDNNENTMIESSDEETRHMIRNKVLQQQRK
jgi:hypothetical protein